MNIRKTQHLLKKKIQKTLLYWVQKTWWRSRCDGMYLSLRKTVYYRYVPASKNTRLLPKDMFYSVQLLNWDIEGDEWPSSTVRGMNTVLRHFDRGSLGILKAIFGCKIPQSWRTQEKSSLLQFFSSRLKIFAFPRHLKQRMYVKCLLKINPPIMAVLTLPHPCQ